MTIYEAMCVLYSLILVVLWVADNSVINKYRSEVARLTFENVELRQKLEQKDGED